MNDSWHMNVCSNCGSATLFFVCLINWCVCISDICNFLKGLSLYTDLKVEIISDDNHIQSFGFETEDKLVFCAPLVGKPTYVCPLVALSNATKLEEPCWGNPFCKTISENITDCMQCGFSYHKECVGEVCDCIDIGSFLDRWVW